MFTDSLLLKYRKWAARLVLGTLLTCTGCTSTRELVRTPPRDNTDVFVAPLARTGATSESPKSPESAQAPVVLVSSWRKRSSEPKQSGAVVHASAEKIVTEVTVNDPALMNQLPAVPEEPQESGPQKPPAIQITPELPPESAAPLPAEERPREPGNEEKADPKPVDPKPEPGVETEKPTEGKSATEKDTDQKPEGQSAPPEPLPLEVASGPLLTLEEAENLARAGNPALLQAGEAIEKARGYHLQLGLKPNPQVGYTASEVFNEGHAGQQGIYINQTFVRGHKQELDQEVLCREISRLEWEFRVQETRVLTDVRQQYFQVLGNQRRVELLKRLEETVLAAADGLKRLVDAGEIPEVDYLQINLLASELKLKRENAEIELNAGRHQLAALMGKPDLGVGEVAGDLGAETPAADLEAMYSQLLANSPQVRAANERIARAQAMIMRQERQNVPNLLAQGALMQDTSTNHTIFNLQLGIDLPYHNRNQGNIAAAVADYRRAVEQRRQLELALRSQLAQTLGQLQQAENSVRVYRDSIVPQSQQNLTKVKTAYDAGELDLTRLFVAQQGNVEASLQMITAQVNHRQLQALVDGTLLTGGLINEVDTELDSGLRGASLDGQ